MYATDFSNAWTLEGNLNSALGTAETATATLGVTVEKVEVSSTSTDDWNDAWDDFEDAANLAIAVIIAIIVGSIVGVVVLIVVLVIACRKGCCCCNSRGKTSASTVSA